jgi:drug/metabolite transporter (DMT)-like permease
MNKTRQPSSWALVVGFAALYISWGTTYLPTRIAVHDENMPPLLFGGIRVLCGGILLLCYQLGRGVRVRLASGDFLKILGISGLLFVTGAGFLNMASQTVASGVCAVLAATTPLWLGLFAMLWRNGDRLTRRGWMGLAVGLVGVVILLAPTLSGYQGLLENVGVFLVLGSAISWALGSLVLRHTRLSVSHLTTAAYQMICGGAGLALAGIFFGELERWPDHVTPRAVQAFIYLLLFGSLVGFVAFNWLISHVAAAKVGTYAYVNPMIAVVVGWSAGEEFTGWLAAGICVILFGVFLIRRGERPAPVATTGESVPEDMSAVNWQMAQASEPS